MGAEDDVRAALARSKPGDALLSLARRIDALEAAGAVAPGVDPWALTEIAQLGQASGGYDPAAPPRGREWEVFPGLSLNTANFGWDGKADTWTKEVGVHMYEAAMKLIGDPLPGDDGEWAARRALAADLRTQPTREVLYIKGETIGNAGYTAGEDDTAVEITLPTPTDEQRAWRRQFATQLGWDQPDWLMPTGGSPIVDSFVEGGPLLMFHGYREYLEQIPPAYLQRMISHWADCGYPMDAAIMTADLLRAEDSLDYESALGTAGARSATLPGGRG